MEILRRMDPSERLLRALECADEGRALYRAAYPGEPLLEP
jgi:hypothetical protein